MLSASCDQMILNISIQRPGRSVKKNWEVNAKHLDNEFNCIICSNWLANVNHRTEKQRKHSTEKA